MYAHLGDRLLVRNPATGAAGRAGEIVGLHHEDGTPPYYVRWSGTDRVTLLFPGPDARVAHRGHDRSLPAASEATATDTVRTTKAGAGRPGDLGRRLVAARRHRGLGREEVARRARMAPQYLAYLETQTGNPGTGALVRLSDALGTTLRALQGGDLERPPGRGRPPHHPRLRALGQEECWDLLSTHGLGRISLTTRRGPAVLPVTYQVAGRDIAFRTEPDGTLAEAAGREVAFEADHVDDVMSQGWSVLIVGRVRAVTRPAEIQELEQAARTGPWPGGQRTLWLLVEPGRTTGRRIVPAEDA
ncbi:pyridoxamine 5'-phosphate oxidase family protein [Streptomyces sp. NPDC023723]|uniref:pyridoxamine 5'-phosphate oxidase family protein n=1 Tax=Streptomyces sp. NPDC023723 TaxID=3154323 RepID=UPI0033EF3FE4